MYYHDVLRTYCHFKFYLLNLMNINDLNKVLWKSANTLRNTIESSNYKSIVLGLVFLRSLSFRVSIDINQQCICPKRKKDNPLKICLIKKARWETLVDALEGKNISEILDNIFYTIEKHNPWLKDSLPTDFKKFEIPDHKLVELIVLIDKLGDISKDQNKDIFGHIYEYFLGTFAMLEGQRGGEYYTPSTLVDLLVRCLAPTKGLLYDPCCGSGGMFVQADKYASNGNENNHPLIMYGQESNSNTRKLALMNLFIRNIYGNIGDKASDTFINDLHNEVYVDYVLANPPFNVKNWDNGYAESQPWPFGKPKNNNANFAWVQKIFNHLEVGGSAAIILANGSLSSSVGGDYEIRKSLICNDSIDAIIKLPGQLFWNTQISACIWILSKNKKNGKSSDGKKLRKRKGEILFIEATRAGKHIDRIHKELTQDDVDMYAKTYRGWRGEKGFDYMDLPGYWKSCTTDEVELHNYALVPGRYVGFSKDECINDCQSHINEVLDSSSKLFEEFLSQTRKSIKKVESILYG